MWKISLLTKDTVQFLKIGRGNLENREHHKEYERTINDPGEGAAKLFHPYF